MTAAWGVLFAIFALWCLLMAALTWWEGKREASSGAASSHRRIPEVDQQFAAEVVSAALSSAPRAPLSRRFRDPLPEPRPPVMDDRD
jgi:hypothetical protein